MIIIPQGKPWNMIIIVFYGFIMNWIFSKIILWALQPKPVLGKPAIPARGRRKRHKWH